VRATSENKQDIATEFINCSNISDFLNIWITNKLLNDKEQKILEIYYGNYIVNFSHRIQRFYESQTKEVLSLIKKKPGLDLLEVGCGCGTESLWFALQGANVNGIDLKRERLNVVRERKSVVERLIGKTLACNFEEMSLLDLSPSVQYDIIWMEQTFHHLEPRETMCEHICQILKPGGKLVISETNGLNPIIQLQLFLKRGINTVTEYRDKQGQIHIYGNERILSANKLSYIFNYYGIIKESIEYFRILPSHPYFDFLENIEFRIGNHIPALNTHFNYVGIRN